MRRIACLCLGFALLAILGASPSGESSPTTKPYGIIGEMAVLHSGRIKPLDTFARLQVKQVYTRENIKLLGPDGKTSATWEPLAALLDWRARPEFWDEQEIIAFEYLPLKQMLFAIPIREVLEKLAKVPGLSAEDRKRVEDAAKDENVSSTDLKAAASLPGVPADLAKQLKTLAHKVSPDQKWLAPSDLETGRIQHKDHEEAFLDWLEELARRPSPRPEFDEEPVYTPIEKKALDAGKKIDLYRAMRDGNVFGDPRFDIQVVPRPLSAKYLTFTTEAINKLRAYMKTQPPNRTGRFNPLEAGLTPLELNSINQYQSYAELLKVRDREDPGLNAEFDAAFVEWIREKAGWIPLRILMAAEPVELGKAGFDTAKVETFRKAYEAVLSEEKAKPGQLSAEAANALVVSARDLGESVAIPYLLQKNTEHKSWSDLKPDRVEMFKKVRDPMVALTSLPPESKATLLVAARSLSPTIVAYPSAAEMRQETNFNAFAPFYKSQFAYGIALVMLLLSLGMNASPSTTAGKVERGVYGIGLAALLTGIGLEVLGFNYRIHISGWAPVTNMYETVIWVALVSSVLGFVLELIYRKKYAATAAAGVALLGTVLAANVSLLDPDIKNLQPVLRSNYWLTIHVLTIVSSYAAFALAMGLGLLAIGYYLSATYKRDVSYGKLALPLLPGLPLLVVGMYGLLARTNVSSAPTQMTMAEYSLAGMALGGLSLTIVALFGLIGEAASRASSKTLGAGLALLVAGVLGTASLSLGLETPEWWPSNLSFPVVPSLVAGLGLTMIILSRMGAIARAPLSEAPQSKPSSPKDEFAEAFPPPSPLTKKPTVAEIRARQEASRTELDPRSASMQSTAAKIKPLANFTYRAMQVGVLLVAAGTILGGVWADYSWGRFWGWDAKEVWALITLLVYLVPLHGRFAGWVNTFGLIASSVVCFASVMMAWYGVNFVLSTGLHAYGFTDGGGQGIVLTSCISIFAVVVGTWRRRRLGSIA